MPENIQVHTRAVVEVADAVAAAIEKKRHAVNKELVNRGALLHDIAKIISIKKKREVRHTKVGAQIIEQEGFPKKLADIVCNHGLDEFSDALTLEEQIVNYADKRVMHDTIVSLKERMDDLKVRYPAAAEVVEKKLPLYEEFEKKYGINF